MIKRFRVVDRIGNVCRAGKYRIIILSNEVRRDQMRGRSSIRFYYETEDGRRLDPIEGQPGAYQVLGSDEIVHEDEN